MRIPSGVVDQYIYFVAVDATDLKTRETGLSSFTVYRSRDGGAAAAMTTPTVNETDAANMPGVYELLLDEDMTIGSGNDSEEMCFHVTHAGMAPVTRVIELYRPKITAGNTLGVASDGDISGNVDGNVVGSVASVTAQVTANVTAISGDSGAADNLELDYDGTGYNKSNSTIGACTANTDMRGTDSAFLAANAPTNFSDLSITSSTGRVDVGSIEGSDATNQIKAQSDASLVDIHLDHLFAVDYDPASKPGTSTALLNELIEDDSGVSRYTVNALENAPSGGGSSDWTASEREEIRDRLGVTGTTSAGGNTPTLATAAAVAAVDTKVDANPTAAEIRAEMDSNSTQLAAIVADTNEIQTDWADGGRLDLILDARASQVTVDAVLADTGTDIPAQISGLSIPTSASIRAEIDSNSTQLSAIVSDTNELQSDWVDGGRLDVILDAKASQSSVDTIDNNVDSILLDTGTTLPGLLQEQGINKNAPFSNFEFLLVMESDGQTPATGLTVTGQRSIDGGAFASVSGVISEVSNGIYQFDALAADTNGDVITWRFSAGTALDRFVTFKTVQ